MKPIGSLLFAFALSAACVPHSYVKTKTLTPELAGTFAHHGEDQNPKSSKSNATPWWKDFADERLEKLVHLALDSNLDIEMARSRFDHAHALARKSGAVYWPQIETSFSGARNQSISPFNQESVIKNRFDFSVAAAYEVDLWGKYRTQRAGALMDVQASENDIQTISMTIAAQVAESWYLLAEQRSQHRLLIEQTQVNDTMYKLVQARFDQGLATALDVFQQHQQLIRTRRRLPPTEAQIVVLENQLSVLLGKSPGHALPKGPIKLPQLTDLPRLGIPADLLAQRPDIRASRERVQAADHRAASALADRFPSLRLSASAGLQTENLEDLVDGFIWNLVGGLVMPLIDGGRRGAEVDRQAALVRQALAQYKKTIITAIQEVENALIRLEKQSTELEELALELRVAQSTFSEAQNRYLQGLGNYLPVLTAIRSLQEAERAQLNSKRQLVSQRIQLYRALGGNISKAPSKGTP
jgi:outer membrane protein, multidrug efflux system